MGFYLFNISVDADDPHPRHIVEDLSFNDQESIIEFVVEKILGYSDAIQEYDDNDTEDHNSKHHVKVDFLVHTNTLPKPSYPIVVDEKQAFLRYDARLMNGFRRIETPPPKV